MLIFLFITSGCVPPVYEGTTYGMEDFVADSVLIAAREFTSIADENCCLSADEHLDFQDLIVEGDELFIELYSPQRSEHAQAFRLVDERVSFHVVEGKVCMPILGSVDVGEMTLLQAQEKIQNLYLKELKHVQVFVGFKKRKERQVQVIGARQSMISVEAGTRLSEVLARSALFPYSNLSKSYVVRNGNRLRLDFYKLIHEGDETQNIVLRGGDQIFIAKHDEVMIMLTGEVSAPQMVPIPYGSISLLEALAIARGIPFTGDRSQIYVLRGQINRPKIYCLMWKDLVRQRSESILLMGGDVVFVAEEAITQWNRFIMQLQPSSICLEKGNGVFY